MESEFDKEIDFLLRKTARSETAPAAKDLKSAHLDADEIAAFAENALPEKARLNRIAHLADCDYCRKNLSNLIALNSDAPSEIVHAENAESLAAAPEIPWYRKLFAVPNLAYAMGALVLLFSGFAVYIVLQSGAKDAQVSSVYEKQSGGKGMSADGDAPMTETYSNRSMSNMAAMNTTANVSTNSAASASNTANFAAPPTLANSNSTAIRKEAEKDLTPATKPAETQNESEDRAKTADSIAPGTPPAPVKENNLQIDGETARQQPNAAPQQQQNQITQNQTQIMPDSRNAQRSPSGAALQENKRKKLDEASDDKQEKSSNTTIVGGKTFRRENSVWYDSSYQGQATTNISRGTNEYKKLDSGLRQIVERIGGTVVVVWKEKAYRIQ